MAKKLLFTIAFLLTTTVLLHGQTTDNKPITDSLTNTETEFAWVIFNGDSLFKISQHFGPYSPSERAELVERHLDRIFKEINTLEDSFNIQNKPTHSLLLYGNSSILSVTDDDADAIGYPRTEVIKNYLEIIKDSFESNMDVKSITFWLISIGKTILLLLGLILIFYIINRVTKWLTNKLINYEKGLKRKRKNVLKYLVPAGPDSYFVLIARLLRWIVILFVLILYLPLLFSYIPYTKGLVFKFYGYITTPIMYIVNGLIDFLPNLFFILVIFFIARYISRVLSYISGEIEKEKLTIKGFHKEWAKPTLNIFKIIVYAFALVFVFPYLPGSDSPAFQGISIFIGVLLSLGSTSAIANIIAGIVITYMRPFTIGDRVKIGETMGDVISKSLLVTKVRTMKNEVVAIPNATIINAHLWNYTISAKDLGVILHTSVTIGYDVPWETVNKLLLEAAKNTKNLSREFKPFVLQKGLNDFYVEYELNVYTKQPSKMALFYSELHRNILDAFNKEGIEILSPHYNAIRDGNDGTIPTPPDNCNPVEKVIDTITKPPKNEKDS